MELGEILGFEVTYFDKLWTSPTATNLNSVFTEIRSEKHSRIAKYLSELYSKGDKENYKTHKGRLPVVTFCATFEGGRKKEHLKNYNCITVLDIDKLGVDELRKIKESLLKEEFVFSYWESPSRDGVKGLVHLNYDFNIHEVGIDESHKIAFNQLVEYFSVKHDIELDTSGSDYTRLCFICQDTQLILKKKVESFTIKYKPIHKSIGKSKFKATKTTKRINSKNALYNPIGKNNAYHRKTLKNIIKYLNKNSLSITDSYEKWLRVAFAISNSFTFDIGVKYFNELCILDSDKYVETECENLLINCYENTRGEIGFNTIIHMAVGTGYNYKNINAKST